MNVISVLGFQGGAGRTTIAANLAFALAMHSTFNAKVLLIDIDPNMGLTQYILGKEFESDYVKHNKLNHDNTGKNLYSFVKDWSEKIQFNNTIIGLLTPNEEEEKFTPIKIGEKNLFFIPSHPNLLYLNPDNDPYQLISYFKKINEQYDYVIIDTPSTPSVFVNSAIYASSYYLSVFSPGCDILATISLLNDFYIQNVVNQCSDEKIDLGIVINKIKTDNQFSKIVSSIIDPSEKQIIHQLFRSCADIKEYRLKKQINSKFVFLSLPGDRRKSHTAHRLQSELIALAEQVTSTVL